MAERLVHIKSDKLLEKADQGGQSSRIMARQEQALSHLQKQESITVDGQQDTGCAKTPITYMLKQHTPGTIIKLPVLQNISADYGLEVLVGGTSHC